jgi:hypothetical protein
MKFSAFQTLWEKSANKDSYDKIGFARDYIDDAAVHTYGT